LEHAVPDVDLSADNDCTGAHYSGHNGQGAKKGHSQYATDRKLVADDDVDGRGRSYFSVDFRSRIRYHQQYIDGIGVAQAGVLNLALPGNSYTVRDYNLVARRVPRYDFVGRASGHTSALLRGCQN